MTQSTSPAIGSFLTHEGLVGLPKNAGVCRMDGPNGPEPMQIHCGKGLWGNSAGEVRGLGSGHWAYMGIVGQDGRRHRASKKELAQLHEAYLAHTMRLGVTGIHPDAAARPDNFRVIWRRDRCKYQELQNVTDEGMFRAICNNIAHYNMYSEVLARSLGFLDKASLSRFFNAAKASRPKAIHDILLEFDEARLLSPKRLRGFVLDCDTPLPPGGGLYNP